MTRSGFFSTNIDRRGRLFRAGIGGLLLVGAGFALTASPILAVLLGLGGIFGLVEAARGWCLARACGIKTPL